MLLRIDAQSQEYRIPIVLCELTKERRLGSDHTHRQRISYARLYSLIIVRVLDLEHIVIMSACGVAFVAKVEILADLALPANSHNISAVLTIKYVKTSMPSS